MAGFAFSAPSRFRVLLGVLSAAASVMTFAAQAQESPSTSTPSPQGNAPREGNPNAGAEDGNDADDLREDTDWSCEPGDRTLEREGAGHDRRIDKWLCRRRRPVRLLVGVSHRGVLSETGTFADKLGFEAGVRLFSRADLAVGLGQVFKDGAALAVDVHGRFFLFDFPGTGGPYLGGGWRFKETKRGFVTFGFFGGGGLFFELQFRGSDKQPIAVVPAFGLRYAFP